MGKFFRNVAAFFHSHPAIKTTAVGALGAAVNAAAAGAFGPKGMAVAGAVTTVAALWTKRPSDATEADKAGEKNEAAQ